MTRGCHRLMARYLTRGELLQMENLSKIINPVAAYSAIHDHHERWEYGKRIALAVLICPSSRSKVWVQQTWADISRELHKRHGDSPKLQRVVKQEIINMIANGLLEETQTGIYPTETLLFPLKQSLRCVG